MGKRTLVHREVGNKLHLLNYSVGKIMSFARDDGRFLLANVDCLDEAGAAAGSDVLDFLNVTEMRVSSRSFRSSLINLGTVFCFPTVLHLELNRRCVLRCQHCYIPTLDLMSNAESVFEQSDAMAVPVLIDALHGMGVFLVVLTGGEVFLNRQFRALLGLLAERGFVTEIFSSLQFLPEWFLKVDPLDSRVGRIQTSVYSVDPSIHDEITGTHGSLDRTLKNVRFLYEQGFYIEVATPLLRSNFASRFEIEDYFLRCGIRQTFAWPIVSEYYGGSQKKELLNISKEEFLQFCIERPDFLIHLDPSARADDSVCAAGRSLMSISANGDVYACSQFPKPVGNILSSDLKSVYQSSAMRQIAAIKVADLPEDIFRYNFCPGNNYSETGDPLRQSEVVRGALAYYERHVTGNG
jgi:MoaA/NifB/PqqE/SkfB family radical SAM enzyme